MVDAGGDENVPVIVVMFSNTKPTSSLDIDGSSWTSDRTSTIASEIYDVDYANISVSVTVNTPNGGEAYTVGDAVTIEWDASGTYEVDIYYALSRGPWVAITVGAADTGSYGWTVPDAPSDEAQIKICADDEIGRAPV